MPQQSRMLYVEDERTDEQRESDTRAWVKEHSTDYRKQKQAASGMPPEDPSRGYSAGDYRPDDKKSGWPMVPIWHTWVYSLMGTAIGVMAAYLVFS